MIFEQDETRDADKVSQDKLREILGSASNFNPELVFVASCHSEPFAEIWLNAGAEHVIAIDKDQKVLDEICIEFTRIFYDKLTSSEKICDAFYSALDDCKKLYENE